MNYWNYQQLETNKQKGDKGQACYSQKQESRAKFIFHLDFLFSKWWRSRLMINLEKTINLLQRIDSNILANIIGSFFWCCGSCIQNSQRPNRSNSICPWSHDENEMNLPYNIWTCYYPSLLIKNGSYFCKRVSIPLSLCQVHAFHDFPKFVKKITELTDEEMDNRKQTNAYNNFLFSRIDSEYGNLNSLKRSFKKFRRKR